MIDILALPFMQRALIAAVDSALPASVPPTPPTSTMSASPASVWRVIAAATAALMPYAPDGMPPPIDLP